MYTKLFYETDEQLNVLPPRPPQIQFTNKFVPKYKDNFKEYFAVGPSQCEVGSLILLKEYYFNYHICLRTVILPYV